MTAGPTAWISVLVAAAGAYGVLMRAPLKVDPQAEGGTLR
jgi:hypothetical protein